MLGRVLEVQAILTDKTHNAEAILYDYQALGDQLWSRFNGGAEGTRWYYIELANVFAKAMPGPLANRLNLEYSRHLLFDPILRE